jgi:predicted short-subunit dehydrogenase-like oxidoreductase (DUF2520 family)
MLFDKLTYKLDEIVYYFLIRTIRATENGDNMIVVNTSSNDEFGVFQEYRKQTGKCYSFHPNDYIAGLGIYYIRMQL